MARHHLTIREPSSIFGKAQRATEVCSFAFYDNPCALALKGDLESLIRKFPLGTLASEIIESISCKDHGQAPCDPVYLKADELLVSENALMLWENFRKLLGKVELIYLPSQLSELVRYNSDFDSSDKHINYGDEKAAEIDAALHDPLFEASLFRPLDHIEEDERYGRFERSFITQRRRLRPARFIEHMPLPERVLV
jgi:hypothetical protein